MPCRGEILLGDLAPIASLALLGSDLCVVDVDVGQRIHLAELGAVAAVERVDVALDLAQPRLFLGQVDQLPRSASSFSTPGRPFGAQDIDLVRQRSHFLPAGRPLTSVDISSPRC